MMLYTNTSVPYTLTAKAFQPSRMPESPASVHLNFGDTFANVGYLDMTPDEAEAAAKALLAAAAEARRIEESKAAVPSAA